MAGGGANLMTWTLVPNSEDHCGKHVSIAYDITIASGTYPTNGYTLDPSGMGQIGVIKNVEVCTFAYSGAGWVGYLFTYDTVNKSMRIFSSTAGTGAFTEASGTVGGATNIVRVQFWGTS